MYQWLRHLGNTLHPIHRSRRDRALHLGRVRHWRWVIIPTLALTSKLVSSSPSSRSLSSSPSSPSDGFSRCSCSNDSTFTSERRSPRMAPFRQTISQSPPGSNPGWMRPWNAFPMARSRFTSTVDMASRYPTATLTLRSTSPSRPNDLEGSFRAGWRV